MSFCEDCNWNTVKCSLYISVCTVATSLVEQLSVVHNETLIKSLARLCGYLPEPYKSPCHEFADFFGQIIIERYIQPHPKQLSWLYTLISTISFENIYNGIIWHISFIERLLKNFSSILDYLCQQIVRQRGRITCTVINTSNEFKWPRLLLREFWIHNFSWTI